MTGRGADDFDPFRLGPPSHIVPVGEEFECPCGSGFKFGPVTSTVKWTSVETQCPACKAVVVLDGG